MDAVEESNSIAEGGGCRGEEGWEERDEGVRDDEIWRREGLLMVWEWSWRSCFGVLQCLIAAAMVVELAAFINFDLL